MLFRSVGDLSPLSAGLQRQVRDAIELTKANDRMTLAIAFNYGGRAEIVEAVRRIVEEGVPTDQIDEDLFAARLLTKDLPDPDLIIRTAGEMRLSNFLLWQGAYAEFCFTPVFWPDFDIQHIDEALDPVVDPAAKDQAQTRLGETQQKLTATRMELELTKKSLDEMLLQGPPKK